MDLPATSLAPSRPGARGFGQLMRQSLSAHAHFFVVALGYLLAFQAACLIVPQRSTEPGHVVLVQILMFSLPVLVLSLAGYCLVEMALYEKPAHPIPALWRKVKATLTSAPRMAQGLPTVGALIIFMYVFTMVKGNITAFVPFAWDATLDRWDTALHFGLRPWQILQPILGYWPITFALNVNYNLWFFVMNAFWIHYAFFANPGVERTRYFLAFMLMWIVGGSLMAVYFSSAGPCYYERLGLSPDPYAALMSNLHGVNNIVPVWALNTQDMLWNFRNEGSAFGGVSAMPSMHCANALLFVLTAWKAPRWLRNLLIVHCALIFLGSIALGWHYAVDGYVAWALAVSMWWLAGFIARWWESDRQREDFSRALTVGT
jgi:hypothetical protein